MISFMYITNRPDVALIAQQAGVERIFLDLERLGKSQRQFGMDTVVSSHTLDDIVKVRRAITQSELLVRCNSIYEES